MENLVDLDGGFTGNDGDDFVRNIRIVPGRPTGMLSWLVTKKIVKNARQAEKVLFGVAIAAVLITVGVLLLNFYQPQNAGVPGRLGAPVQTAATHT